MDQMFLGAASFKQKLCGPDWISSLASKAGMFAGSPGLISWHKCKSAHRLGTQNAHPYPKHRLDFERYASRQPITERYSSRRPNTERYASRRPISERYASRQPISERELITRTPISTPSITPTVANAMTCSKCGTFEKSGRVSCCAPGGAWYKNCGGAKNRIVEHRWFDGLKACESKSKADGMQITKQQLLSVFLFRVY